MIRLEEFSDTPPEGAASLLKGLGEGESGFSGTDFGAGRKSMSEYLRTTMRQAYSESLPAGWVAQTTFWIVEDSHAVGLLRLRHRLNESLRVKGGHIGYYVSPEARRRGIASKALGLALLEARKLEINKVMLTTSPDNSGSIKVIEGHSGLLRAQVEDPEDGSTINQYWIENQV